MHEGFWIITDDGSEQFVYYDDIDEELLPIYKPIGGFCYPAEGFLRLKLTPAPFYIKDWLPKQGKAEVFGTAKAGKSYLALQLARCIGAGVSFLGLPVQQGRVLYLQFELGLEALQSRVKSTGQTYEDVYVGTTFGMKLDTLQGQKQLMAALEAIRPQVLLLDPLYKLLKGDENEAHDVEVVTDFIDGVIEAFNCSVVVFHHAGKDQRRGGRGSSVIEGWVDSCINIKKVSKESEPLRVKLAPTLLRHAGLPPEPIEAVLEDYEFKVVGAAPTVTEQVAEFLQKSKESVSIQDIIDAGIGSRRSVYDARNVLLRQEKVVESTKGRYQWKERSVIS